MTFSPCQPPVGTGTLQAYGFTTIDITQSTTDTVVLRYRSGKSCTACGDGVVTTVRYRWDGANARSTAAVWVNAR